MQKLIVWQKWADPFGFDDDPVDLEDEPHFLDEEDNIIEPESVYEDEAKTKKDETYKKLKVDHIRVMATPMGIIPVNENTSSSKIFNFWVGHTNFNITKSVARIIEDTDGVETLDIFTRYRFRIGIGKVFTDSEVMRDINENVYEHLG